MLNLPPFCCDEATLISGGLAQKITKGTRYIWPVEKALEGPPRGHFIMFLSTIGELSLHFFENGGSRRGDRPSCSSPESLIGAYAVVRFRKKTKKKNMVVICTDVSLKRSHGLLLVAYSYS